MDILLYLLSKWKWFLLSVAVCVGLAWFQYARTPQTFFRSSTVIIKDPSNKTVSAGLDRYDNYINKVNVSNEILQFKSRRLLSEVVSRTRADVSYKMKSGLRAKELYTGAPVTVSFLDATPERYLSFSLTPKNDSEVLIQNVSGDGTEGKFNVKINDTTLVAGNRILVTKTNFFSRRWFDTELTVTKLPLRSVVSSIAGSIGIRQEEDDASILTLSMRDGSPERAENIINTLISVYNEEAVNDKNQVAVNTAEFINERLVIIERELGGVESDLESFKKANQIVDLSSAAGMYMGESQKYNSSVLELDTQLRLAEYIKEYLTDPVREIDLIPSNTGISDINIESQIGQYNAAKLRRDKLIEDSSEKNPVVVELNNSLRAMKQSIIRAVDNMIVSLNVRKTDAMSREKNAQYRVASIPTKQRQMLSIERQQKIKESLYLFLLNKREENALTQAMADNNARVIDEAYGPVSPIAPNRNKILFLGLLLGLAIPCVIFLMIMFLDTRVHSRKDLQGKLTLPFLGTVPEKKDDDSYVREALKIVRTNLAFMSRKDKPLKVIATTSINEGAGKTFISTHLADSLLSAGKKVVLLDLDIRKGTLSHNYGKRSEGVTNFIIDESLSVDDVIHKNEGHPDIVTAGSPAPNPAELLMDQRLDVLVEGLKERYDYIIADSVPAGMVADAAISARVADLTVFVIRAGRLDKRQLPDIEAMYQEKKFNNLAVVMNGVEYHSRGYGYGHGYGYGYGYGHGYGYGYIHKKSDKKK